MKLISSGAEASLFKRNKVAIKKRLTKGYRIKILDEKIRKTRTRREAKILQKAEKLIPSPKLISSSEKTMEIKMEFLDGKKLSKTLDKEKDSIRICKKIGENIAKLHDAGIIHGDLTTSNMILKNNQVYFIDYGLSFESNKSEDKAVDLHLIKQALEAKHYTNFEKYFKAILEGYKISKNSTEILKRLLAVEKRGRYKQAY
jgi:TP53 regulating kinase-like protein